MDLRIQKTYKLLTQTFLELLEEKRFEDITVNELCERAMIRRATFYKHFADKYDFFSFFIRSMQDQFMPDSEANPLACHPRDYCVRIIDHTFDFFAANEKLVHSLLKSSVLPMLINIFSEHIVCEMQLSFKEYRRQGFEFPLAPEIMAHIFSGALLHTLQWWVVQKNRISKEELVSQLAAWIHTL